MTDTPTTDWLTDQARTIATALGLPVDRLDTAGDPYRVPDALHADYAATLTGTPLADLAATARPDAMAGLHAAEQVMMAADPDGVARQMGDARRRGAVATSVWQVFATADGVTDWADDVLARHRVDVRTWRQHVEVMHRAGQRHATRTRTDRWREQERDRTTCVCGGHTDRTTTARRDLPDAPRLCDTHDAALRHELARRDVDAAVRDLADRLAGPPPAPTPADVVPRRGLFR